MRVPPKSASKVQFQAIWSCYYAKLVRYFPAENMAQLEQNALIRNPFQTDISLKYLLAANEAQLIDLSCDENLMGKFSDSSVVVVVFNTDYGSSEPLKTLVMLCYISSSLC